MFETFKKLFMEILPTRKIRFRGPVSTIRKHRPIPQKKKSDTESCFPTQAERAGMAFQPPRNGLRPSFRHTEQEAHYS